MVSDGSTFSSPDSRGALIDAAWAELCQLARRELVSTGADVEGHQASSLLDEAMVQMLKQHGEIRNLSQLRGLTTLFLRRIISDRRRRARLHRRYEDARASEPDPVPRHSAEGRDITSDLAEALAALGEYDERKFSCLSLSAAHGFANDEIARALGTSRATVERDLRFARAFVAARLGISHDRSR